MAFAKRAKTLHEKAKAAGVPAITTTGIYPGISNVMAAEMIAVSQAAAASKTAEDGTHTFTHTPHPQVGSLSQRTCHTSVTLQSRFSHASVTLQSRF
eukprot:3528794-Pyramimonas_sp.AAC.1